MKLSFTEVKSSYFENFNLNMFNILTRKLVSKHILSKIITVVL